MGEPPRSLFLHASSLLEANHKDVAVHTQPIPPMMQREASWKRERIVTPDRGSMFSGTKGEQRLSTSEELPSVCL